MPEPEEPVTDVINRIAAGACGDTRHRIHVRGDDGGVRSMTTAELDRQARRVAAHLHALGVGRGDRIGVMAGNGLSWVLLDLAVLKLGGVTAGFEPGRFEPSRLVAEYGLRLLFADGTQASGPARDLAEVGGWAAGPDRPLPPSPGYDPADICAVKFTSGSTGAPKGLEVTVASVNASLAAVQELFAHGDGDNLLVFLRLALLQQRYWIYSALVHGHDVTVSGPDEVLDMATATAPTVVMGVPGFYEALRARLEARGPLVDARARGEAIQAALGGRIRYLWTGSAPASRALLEFFNDAGVPLYEGYGLNETCIVAKNHPGAFRLGSVGKVVPGKRVRFDRESVLIVASRSPVNCRYTWCGPGVNERMFLPTGEVRTHDLGHVDEDGYLYIHGRVDDVLTLSTGRNIVVRPVEERVRECPGVHECVLYGTGRAFLSAVVSPGAAGPDPAALADFVAGLNATLLPEQRVYGLVIAPEPFSVEHGLLTSQFKPVREAIHRRYARELTAVYDAAPEPPARPMVVVPRVRPAPAAGQDEMRAVRKDVGR